jgi:hypothetical protein
VTVPAIGQWNAAINCEARYALCLHAWVSHNCRISGVTDVFLAIALVRHVLDWA